MCGVNDTKQCWHVQYDIQVIVFHSIKIFLKEIIQLRKTQGTFLCIGVVSNNEVFCDTCSEVSSVYIKVKYKFFTQGLESVLLSVEAEWGTALAGNSTNQKSLFAT